MHKAILTLTFVLCCLLLNAQSFCEKLEASEPGEVVRTYSLIFHFDSRELRTESFPYLDSIADCLIEHDNLMVEIGIHFDSRWSPEYSIDIGAGRANFLRDYFVSKGVEQNRLTAKSYGDSQLLNHCGDGVSCNEGEHQANRRIEFKVISTTFKSR